jgi:hypothetical protein
LPVLDRLAQILNDRRVSYAPGRVMNQEAIIS